MDPKFKNILEHFINLFKFISWNETRKFSTSYNPVLQKKRSFIIY